MALTLSAARSALRARLNEPSAAQWTDAELDAWLNEGAADIASRTECLLDTHEATVTANVRSVAPPDDLLRIYRAEFEPTGESQTIPLRYKDYMAMDRVWGHQTSGANYPEFWTSWGMPPSTTLYLYPTPHVGGILRVYYYRTAAPAIEDTDTLDLVDGWAHYLYDYAEYRAFLRVGDQRWQHALAKHEANIAQIIDMTRRITDQPGEWGADAGMFGGGYGGGPWFNNMVGGW